MPDEQPPPILSDKHFRSPSAFTPESLLREARRQLGTTNEPVPAVCMLDPDGDVVRRLRAKGRTRRHDGWACYHTELEVFEQDGIEIGVVGCAVGAPFAVLLAEELFASGCRHLISVTSAGQLEAVKQPPYFVLIERALRDEGTSYHYLPPGHYSASCPEMLASLAGAFSDAEVEVIRGATWTTDAPFRETEQAIAAMRERGLLAVEMEAAALYAFARVKGRSVVCFAYVTNQMGTVEGDFEKGEEDGVAATLQIVALTAERLLQASRTAQVP
ncbi:MAG: nucleoside phosphorylase [Halofilum sp. (in: g-proteobacteria)]|nr:nucleoside phosphorylase [Halofilum sp. (in: g-proteobacteria)]